MDCGLAATHTEGEPREDRVVSNFYVVYAQREKIKIKFERKTFLARQFYLPWWSSDGRSQVDVQKRIMQADAIANT